jgi:hypothetical protein
MVIFSCSLASAKFRGKRGGRSEIVGAMRSRHRQTPWQKSEEMTEPTQQKIESASMEVITLHFNVTGHFLPLDDFIDSAKSARNVINCFNDKFFDGKVSYELVVLPPEEGSLKQRLGVVVLCGASFIWGTAGSEFASGVIKARTGKSFYEHGVEFGEAIPSMISKVEAAWDQSLVAAFMAEAAKEFYLSEEDNLKKCGIEKEEYREAYAARNEFYEMCYKNPEIQGVGFDDSENFPVPRRDFARYIVNLPPEKEDDDDNSWKIEIRYITVTSPNWERGDNRLWKAKYDGEKDALFTIEDDAFWKLVEVKQLVPQIFDSMKVQWAYIAENGRRKKTKALRVLEYNGQAVSDPLSDEELESLLGAFPRPKSRQGDLFISEAA